MALRKGRPPPTSGLPITAEDVLESLNGDPVKRNRAQQLLQNWDDIEDMLNAFDYDETKK